MSVEAILKVNGQTLREIFAEAGSVLQEAIIAEMSGILRGEGYVVEIPPKWETPQELCARLQISTKTFAIRVKHPKCPEPFDIVRTRRGVEQLRSTSIFDAFLTHNRRTKPTT